MFVFLSKNRRSVKILYFDRTGYAIWYKKLESGTFSRPEKQELDYRSLSCLLEGIDGSKIKRKKRFLLAKSEDSVVQNSA